MLLQNPILATKGNFTKGFQVMAACLAIFFFQSSTSAQAELVTPNFDIAATRAINLATTTDYITPNDKSKISVERILYVYSDINLHQEIYDEIPNLLKQLEERNEEYDFEPEAEIAILKNSTSNHYIVELRHADKGCVFTVFISDNSQLSSTIIPVCRMYLTPEEAMARLDTRIVPVLVDFYTISAFGDVTSMELYVFDTRAVSATTGAVFEIIDDGGKPVNPLTTYIQPTLKTIYWRWGGNPPLALQSNYKFQLIEEAMPSDSR